INYEQLGPDDEGPPMPSWLPLIGGGGTFVLLDNVLVVTPKESIAKYWAERIQSQSERYHAVLERELPEDAPQEAPLTYETMTREGSNSFVFVGVEWKHHHRRVHIDPDKDPFPPGIDSRGEWKGTRCDMAKALGALLW